MHLLNLSVCFVIAVGAIQSAASEGEQKRLVCSMVSEDAKNPIKVNENAEDLKIVPFSFAGNAGFLESFLPFLKDLPAVDSPVELPPVPVETPTQNISVTCDVVSDDIKKQISDLEEKVATLSKIVKKLEGTSSCPGGVVYLDRCFRLMEISGKKLPYHKSEDLCNFHGGVLAKMDNVLVSALLAEYLLDKFQRPQYANDTFVGAWTGMKYKMATQGSGGTEDGNPFVLPVLTSTKSPEELNKENEFLTWYPRFPRAILTHDRVAFQFRLGSGREVKAFGAVNLPEKRRMIPLCQFKMEDWKEAAKLPGRVFRFN